MLGRGTRRCPDINKEFFTIFDCFDGTLIEYFKDATDFVIEIEDTGNSFTIKEIVDNIWNNIECEYNTKRLIKRLRRVAETMSAKARDDFSAFISEGDITKFTDGLQHALRNNFLKTMELLRDKDFQELLNNYERANDPFIITYKPDDVISERLFPYEGRNLRPQEYLESFTKFIHENKRHVEALTILFSNPHKWNSEALKNIRTMLKRNTFDEEKLQKAHEQSGHKAMADIISLLKNADNNANPLLTAQERVEQTMKHIMAAHTFNEEQKLWLGYIHDHLLKNPFLEKGIFDVMPIFEGKGGLTKAKKVFGANFNKIIDEINTDLVA
jgi:type I restriction enzyme R subunit